MARAPWPRYPEFVPARLLERLAEWFRWPADGILAGNGSNELIQATLAVTVEPGDVVVAPAPTFSLYRVLTAVSGGRYLPVPLDDAFQYDMDRLIEVAVRERAKVVVLNSPNNPTGSRAARRARWSGCSRRPARWCCATRRTWISAGRTRWMRWLRRTGWSCCAPFPRRSAWRAFASAWGWRIPAWRGRSPRRSCRTT